MMVNNHGGQSPPVHRSPRAMQNAASGQVLCAAGVGRTAISQLAPPEAHLSFWLIALLAAVNTLGWV